MRPKVYHYILFFLFNLLFTVAQISADSIAELEGSIDYAKNIKRLESLLKIKPLDSSIELQLRIQLVNNYINVQQYDKATVLCQEGIIAAKQKKDLFAEATYYLGLGRTYYHLKVPEKLSEYSKACLKIAEVQNYTELLKRANHNLGVLELEKQNYLEAEKYFLKAIEYANKLPSSIKDNPGRNYRLLATNYNLQGKNDQADSTFAIAGNIFEELHDTLGLIEVLIFRAGMLKSQKKYTQALKIGLEAVARAKKTNTPDHIQTALSVLQDVYSSTGNYQEALKCMEEIFQMEILKEKRTLSKELADSEVRFNIQELKNQEMLRGIESKQKNQLYIFLFILILISTSAFLIIYFQKKLSAREQEMELHRLQEIHQAAEQERSRIAKDLHDNMGAYTTSLLAQIDQIEEKKGTQRVQQIITLRGDAENIMATLRETIWILKAGPLDSGKFVELLRNYATKHLALNAAIAVNYEEHLQFKKDLSPSTSLNLYRIFQEVVQNIIKHSKANTVTILIKTEPVISLQVTDNGKGFNPSNVENKSGLDNMNFRAQEIGYELVIESGSSGTSIKITELLT